MTKTLALLFLTLTIQYSHAQGIQFQNAADWKQIVSMAQSQHKYIFVDCYASWCGPCKAMERDVYTDAGVGTHMNAHFISVKLQMDTSANDKDDVKGSYATAHEISTLYPINAYPTFLFFSPDGKLVHKAVGYMQTGNFIHLAEDAANPAKQYYTLVEKFNKGEMPAKDGRDFAEISRNFGDEKISNEAAQKYIDEYLLKLPEEQLFADRNNTDFILSYSNSVSNTTLSFFTKDSSRINQLYGPHAAQKKLIALIAESEVAPVAKKSSGKVNWAALEKQETAKYGYLGKMAVLQEQLGMANDAKDWPAFGEAFKKYYDNAGEYNVWSVNSFAWKVYMHCNEKEVLQSAIEAMKRYNKGDDASEQDIYANLLYKNGNREEAIKIETEIVERLNKEAAAKNRKTDPQYTETLEKMKANQPTWP